ncbi:MAG: HAD family hydrolase [Myxococcota bacterium]
MALPPLASVEALLLDLDDTILDDRSGIRDAWRVVVAFLHGERPALAPDAIEAAIAEQTDWFWSDPERERRGRLDLQRARFEILSGVLERLGRPEPALAERAAELYTRQREGTCLIAEGALDALARLREAVPRLALVTNGATRPQRAKIERFSLAAFFDHIQVEGEFGLGKPEPEVYRHVAGSLGASPAGCLMVGDNFRCDVVGALAVGMHAAWVDVEGRGEPPLEAPRAHATVASLFELAQRLGV